MKNALKEQIDRYISNKVDLVLQDRLQGFLDRTLIPLADAFMERVLKERLDNMIRSGVEEALNRLANDFELGYVADVIPESKEEEGMPKIQVMRLMAFLQYYKARHGENSAPTLGAIHTHVGLNSGEVNEAYSILSEKGMISREPGKPKSLKILTKIYDPEKYLENPFK